MCRAIASRVQPDGYDARDKTPQHSKGQPFQTSLQRAPLRPGPIRESLATAVRSSVQRSEFAQGAEQAAHLFQRVVMHQADAQHSAFLFYLKAECCASAWCITTRWKR